MTKATLTQYIRSCPVLLTFYSMSDSFLFVHLFLSILKGERESLFHSLLTVAMLTTVSRILYSEMSRLKSQSLYFFAP